MIEPYLRVYKLNTMLFDMTTAFSTLHDFEDKRETIVLKTFGTPRGTANTTRL
jgi:hypothetical protein